VTVSPTACHSVRYHFADDASSDKSPAYWIFRATLRDGSMFAIDPCNAQYSFTTTRERSCGVYPWESYISRLQSISGNPVDIHSHDFHAAKHMVKPVGNIKDGQQNISVDADVRSTAESMAIGALSVGYRKLPLKTQLYLGDLMARNSNQTKHEEAVSLFKS
jgi:hypothetical protein